MSTLPSRDVQMGRGGPDEGGLSAQRVLAGVWRRRKICLAVALAVGALGAAIVAGTPNVYRANAVVRVEPDRPSHELLSPTVTQPVEDRLKSIESELFAQPLLVRVIQSQNLYPKIVAQSGVNAAAAEMRHHLDVKLDGDDAFSLTYENPDPRVAAAVANSLPALFAQEALDVRAEKAQNATDLFSDELANLSKQVVAQAQALDQFKLAHLGELPEQMESNMRGLDRLTTLLGTRADALRDARRRLVEAKKGRLDADSEAGRLAKREGELRGQLDTAASQFTADYPEVQRLKRELGVVHQQGAASAAAARAADTTRAEAAAEVAALERDVQSLQQQADMYRGRINETPRWSVPLAELDRKYDVLKTKYQQMLSRKVEADLSQELELRARQQMFHVLSPAVAPALPARPDRPAGFMLVALAALALGLLTGVVLELQDDSLREVADAHQALSIPVLATVPDLGRRPLLGADKVLHPAARAHHPTLDA